MKLNSFNNQINKQGYFVLKEYIKENTILRIKKKILKSINKPSNIKIAKNLKLAIKHNPNIIKSYQSSIKYDLTKEEIKKGYKSYGKKTNKILLKNSINIIGDYFGDLINDNMIKIIKKKIRSPKISYIALNCEFKNNLPGNDANLIHTDDNSYDEKKVNLLKLAIPFHLIGKDKFEYRQICIKKKKIKGVKQYMTINQIPKKIKKMIKTPNIENGDAIIFDPNNFYHFGVKTKYNVRIVLTVVITDISHPMIIKAKECEIKKSIYNQLSRQQKNICSLFSKL